MPISYFFHRLHVNSFTNLKVNQAGRRGKHKEGEGREGKREGGPGI